MQSMPSVLLILIQIFINYTSSQYNFLKCYSGTENKRAVYPKYENGIANISPFYTRSADDRNDCIFFCLNDSECFSTSFYKRQCSFFNTTNFEVSKGYPYEYTKWMGCDTKNGYQPSDGRCEGLWITYNNKYIQVTSYPSLNEWFTEDWNCRKLCLDNPLCGFVNRESLSPLCRTIVKWPVKNIEISEKNKSQLDKWTCVDGYKDKLQPEKTPIKPSSDKCTGIWEVTSRNYTVPKHNKYHGLHFQTQIYRECLKECNQYKECVTSLYSVEYSYCILENVQVSYYFLPSDNMSFIRFDYKCLQNDSQPLEMNADEKRYVDLGMKCNRIRKTEKLFIAKDLCGKFPPISDFVQCISQTGITWTITDSCLLDQTYWGFPQKSVKVNISGFVATKTMKIFTGLQSYWLTYSEDNLEQVHFLDCRHFNASRPLEILQQLEIVSRNQWQALPPNGSVIRFTNRIINFDITASSGPYHSCRTKAACTDILRSMQVLLHNGAGITTHFSDIPYNFMVDDSGRIYECRGWNIQSASVSMYNYDTLSIGYIGWFKFYLPNENVLNGIKKLIEYADCKGFVEKNYKVYIHQDLGFFKVHKNLVTTIKNFYRYRGFLPDDCKTISILIVSTNFIVILPFLSIAYLSYFMFNWKQACKRCLFLHDQDCKWKKIFPENDGKGISINSKENYIVYERSTIISSKAHMKLVKLIRLWFINQFLENMNCRCDGNNLKHFLSSLTQLKSDAVIYEAKFKNYDLKDEISRVVLCVNYDKSLDFFKNLIYNRRCICHYFCVEVVDITKISIDVQIRQ